MRGCRCSSRRRKSRSLKDRGLLERSLYAAAPELGSPNGLRGINCCCKITAATLFVGFMSIAHSHVWWWVIGKTPPPNPVKDQGVRHVRRSRMRFRPTACSFSACGTRCNLTLAPGPGFRHHTTETICGNFSHRHQALQTQGRGEASCSKPAGRSRPYRANLEFLAIILYRAPMR